MNNIAHKNGDKTEDLLTHLTEVGEMAAEFGKKFDNEKAARVCGNLHDIGKCSDNMGQVMEKKLFKQDHAIISGIYYAKNGNTNSRFAKQYLPLIMSCHHSYLYNKNYKELKNLFNINQIAPEHYTKDRDRSVIVTNMEEFDKICDYVKEHHLDIQLDQNDLFDVDTMTENQKMFYVRMLASAVTDADCTCTQRFNDGELPNVPKLDPEEMLKKLLAYQINKSDSAPESTIKNIRNEVFQFALKAGKDPKRFRTLTAPTGSGKTLALMAYALVQAITQKSDRIFIVLPYLTITEQNGQEYKEIFVEENVVIVDSQTEYNENTKFLSERWDAPIIITTSVGFFETLFADRMTQLRKLHNVANSVIVFDECQTLPSKDLCCTMEILQELTNHYHTSVLLSTATKPKYQLRNHTEKNEEVFYGHTFPRTVSSMEWDAEEIAPDVDSMFDRYEKWKMLHVTWDINFDDPYTPEKLITFFGKYNQVLYVFNTVQHAKDMYAALYEKFGRENCFILTSKFCSVDKLNMIRMIDERLKAGEPVYLAATTCIEAGVDFDFPAGAREYAPLDSIIQTAGRVCRSVNHNGDFLVFQYINHGRYDFPSECYYVASQISMKLPKDVESIYRPSFMDLYFDKLYVREGYNRDSKELYNAIGQNNFEETKVAYKMIPELQYQVFVLPHDEKEREKAMALMKEIQDGGFIITKKMMKKIGRYTVNVYPNQKHPLGNIASQLYISIAGARYETNWFMLRDQNAYGDMGLDDKYIGDSLIFG